MELADALGLALQGLLRQRQGEFAQMTELDGLGLKHLVRLQLHGLGQVRQALPFPCQALLGMVAHVSGPFKQQGLRLHHLVHEAIGHRGGRFKLGVGHEVGNAQVAFVANPG